MTHTGYSLKRPTLQSNYIKILDALWLINCAEYEPTRKELSKISRITHDQGFDKALNALIENRKVEEVKGKRYICIDEGLINTAVDNDLRRFAE